jgi:prophage regulatory protein
MAHNILRVPEICRRNGGWCPSTLYNRIRDGLWPKLIPLGPRQVGQPDSEVDELLAARIAGRSTEEIKALVKRLEAARKNADQGEEKRPAVSSTTEAAEKPPEPRKKREQPRAKPKGGRRVVSRGARSPQVEA